jgi:hypothetical protein
MVKKIEKDNENNKTIRTTYVEREREKEREEERERERESLKCFNFRAKC